MVSAMFYPGLPSHPDHELALGVFTSGGCRREKEQTFGGIRKGGGPTATVFRSPWQTPNAGPIEPDIESILNKMDRLVTRRDLSAGFAAM